MTWRKAGRSEGELICCGKPAGIPCQVTIGIVQLAVVKPVLVIVADRGFRRSLEFALEAEGFSVDSHARLTTALASPLAETMLCAVIDEDSAEDLSSGLEALDRLGKPIVLLMDRLRALPELAAVNVLVKPLLGNALIETVQRLIACDALRS